MKVKALALAGVAGSFIMTGTATAAFTGVTWAVSDQGAGAGFTTYRFYANFDDPTDKLLSISGNQNVAGLLIQTSTPIVNAPGPFSGLKQEDFAQSPVMPAWDSYVTIDASSFAGNDTDYSPGFLGSGGTLAVIVGSTLSQADNGGWFDSDPTSAADGGMILIAQFTVADEGDGTEGEVFFRGTADYNPGGNPPASSEMFQVDTPAPGVLALLGLAGLAGTRRRRS